MLKTSNYRLAETLSKNATISLSRSVRENGVRENGQASLLVKWPHDNLPTLDDLRRLRHEYEITRNLAIEGVARPLGLEPFRNGLALLLEDYGGQTLDVFLSKTPLETARFLDVALQLAEIAGQVHQGKIVHRDIKPQHILIHPQTLQVELTGFGSAILLQHEAQNTSSENAANASSLNASAVNASVPADEFAVQSAKSSTRLAPRIGLASSSARGTERDLEAQSPHENAGNFGLYVT